MQNIFTGWLKSIAKWGFFIGRDPRHLPGRSVVLFPVMPQVLFCGVAGILAVKGADPEGQHGVVERLCQNFARMMEHGIDVVLEQAIGVEAYLGDMVTLEQMTEDLYALKQNVGLQFELSSSQEINRLRELSRELDNFLQGQEGTLEHRADMFPSHAMESLSLRLILLRDLVWGLKQDLLLNMDKIAELNAGQDPPTRHAFEKFQRFNAILNSLDRLEVRGRDSSGIQVTFWLKDDRSYEEAQRAIHAAGLADEFQARMNTGDLFHRSIHRCGNSLIFTYKTASVAGKLGRNCRELRRAIAADAIFRIFVALDADNEMYLSHTRWASVGAINEPNCHPVNNHTLEADDGLRDYPRYGRGRWCINVALNGDIDNYLALKAALEASGVKFDHRLTTDTKVIPLQVEYYLRQGCDLKEAFLKALGDFDGAHAIALESNLEPGKVYLALRGSGQSLYVGLCPRHYFFASEIYGLVEETTHFIKMDGEREHLADGNATQGQLFVLSDNAGAGINGIEACFYDGHPLALTEKDIQTAQITTRDIDRGDYPHYLLKEILDSPGSIRKTLRGKYRIIRENDIPQVQFNLGEEVVPEKIRTALVQGQIKRIFVIGQGTAAVAGRAIAEALSVYLKDIPIKIQAKTASDLSGFSLDEAMDDSLIIAVTQSGTTTDTNRAVTMAREKGAHLLAIVNRRQSDITTKADGVFYTSDGRDIEMSVASTKAFYSQIVAGYVLALSMAKLLGSIRDQEIARALAALERAPMLMNRVIGRRDEIRKAAWENVRQKKYWAVVGSGTNKVAADEVRIKLSELCYKTISSDIIEDKKHIDLSAEPLILVIAAGSPEIVLEDIVKDTAIFKAHAARVVVITDEGETRFNPVAEHVIGVPQAGFPTSVILNTLAGHIWGYFAACSLDEQASALKDFRNRLAGIVTDHETKGYTIYESMQDKELRRVVDEFFSGFSTWRTLGSLTTLNVETAMDLTLLLKYAGGKLALQDFRDDFQDRRIAPTPLDALDFTLAKAIDELARPVDAIRHQAKTVTVGTSRKVETPRGVLFNPLLELGFSPENLAARGVLLLKRLQKAVQAVRGYTLYRIDGLDEEGQPTDATTIVSQRKGGVAEHMPSRADSVVPLMGTKRTLVRNGEIYAGGGKADDASIVIMPLLGDTHLIEHLLLFHVDFSTGLSVEQKCEILGERYGDIIDLMNEENLPWEDRFLQELPIKFLLGEAVEVIVDRIKARGTLTPGA